MRIVIGCDHAGVDFKRKICSFLRENWLCEVDDVGTHSIESVDYPDIAHAACDRFLEGQLDFGILLCGTGIGMSIASNRYEGIRCALVSSPGGAILSKKHNAANFLSFGCRVMSLHQILNCLIQYNNSNFLEGRHMDRLKKIDKNFTKNSF